jgi:hypothetical protein
VIRNRKMPRAASPLATWLTGAAEGARGAAAHPRQGTGPSNTGTRSWAALIDVETQPANTSARATQAAVVAQRIGDGVTDGLSPRRGG